MLKPLADTSSLTQQDFIDWGQEEQFKTQIGVGECAGVVIDLVATLLFEAEEKLLNAEDTFEKGGFADSIYHSYAALINAAKALLTREQIKTNTHAGIIRSFDENFVDTGRFPLEASFAKLIYQIKEHTPGKDFASAYLALARNFLKTIRQQEKQHEPVQ